MAYGMRNVSKAQPCPICGKPDWCGWKTLESNACRNTIICMRSESRCNVSGVDGREYVYLWDTQGGHARYEERTQHDYYVAEFKKEKQRERQAAKNGTHYSPAKTASVAAAPTFVNLVEPLPHEKLDKIYRALLSMLVLEPKHRQYLAKEGFSDRLIAENSIKSFPENDSYRYKNKGRYFSKNPWRKELARRLVERFGDLTGVPGAYKNQSGEWTFAGKGGILFPLYDEKGYIYRLRVRLDMPYTEDGTFLGKYHNFSSYKEKREGSVIRNIYDCGCAANNNWGLYYHPKDDISLCYITEGEKKGIITNDRLHTPVVILPGVNSYRKIFEVSGDEGMCLVDILKKIGVSVLVVAFDADKATNAAVLKYETETVMALQNEGFIIAVANWDQSIGKGIDDLLVSGGEPVYELYSE